MPVASRSSPDIIVAHLEIDIARIQTHCTHTACISGQAPSVEVSIFMQGEELDRIHKAADISDSDNMSTASMEYYKAKHLDRAWVLK